MARRSARSVEPLEPLGRGPSRVRVLVVHGIFEGDLYARALRARLVHDDRGGAGPARELLTRARITWDVVLAPGYSASERTLIPTNASYRERIQAAIAGSIDDDHDLRVQIHHSWGGGVAVPLWDESVQELGATQRDRDPPADLTILSAPAFADCVRKTAWLGGQSLAVPGARFLARCLYAHVLCPGLSRSGIPELVDLARSMPDGACDVRVALASFRSVLEGRRLIPESDSARRGDGTAPSPVPGLGRAGQRVVVIQGTRDQAIDAKRAIRGLRALLAIPGNENVHLETPALDHFPLLEDPERLAGLLLEAVERAASS